MHAPAAHRQSAVRVRPVDGRRDLSAFIRVPWAVYADDPMWIPPLMLERRQHLSPKSPFFKHARARFWVAERDGKPVGRISAQVDDLHLEQYHDATGYFGFLEAVDDGEVFNALFATAESWLSAQGMRRAIGPFNLSINDECGSLIEGFETPPMFMMGHGRRYYDDRIQECGYRKATDTIAYMIDPRSEPPAVMRQSLRKLSVSRVTIRPLRMSQLHEELAILRDIFNDAWVDNWNFVPFTTDELDALGDSLKLFIPADYVQIAELDGRPVAMIVAMPNLNEVWRDLDGRVLPLGWAKLLWRLKLRPIRSARVPLMGVRRDLQRSALGMALVFGLINAVRGPLCARGVERVELSWTLETNRPMRHIKEKIGARAYKKYRLYEKALGE